MKVALITGVTGQDGSYLAEFLLEKGYEVHGLMRRNSDFTTRRIDSIFFLPQFITHHGDMTDSANLYKLLANIQPQEIYNLGAQSHVGLSFEVPEYSTQVDGIGILRILSAVRDLKLDTRVYQASTSELFGGIPGTEPQNEATPFTPRSPYACSKLYGYWITRNYRESYGIHASNGILFNHESPRRGQTFVTKKITQAVARITQGRQETLKLGTLDAQRDWGYAPEYVETMWKMLQRDEPDDLVIGTGFTHTVRRFVELAFAVVDTKIVWKGEGLEEVGLDQATGKIRITVDPFYFRPSEVEILCADSSKAKRVLGWNPQTSLEELISIMVHYDLSHNHYGHPDQPLG